VTAFIPFLWECTCHISTNASQLKTFFFLWCYIHKFFLLSQKTQRLLHYWSECFCQTNLQIIHPSINYPPLIWDRVHQTWTLVCSKKTITYICHAHITCDQMEVNVTWSDHTFSLEGNSSNLEGDFNVTENRTVSRLGAPILT